MSADDAVEFMTRLASRSSRSNGLGIPMRPTDPGWSSKIPPPDEIIDEREPGLPPITRLSTAPVLPTVELPKRRVAIYYGPKEGILSVAVESAPDWDAESVFLRSYGFVSEMLPILSDLGVRVKTIVRLTDGQSMAENYGRGSPSPEGNAEEFRRISSVGQEENLSSSSGGYVAAVDSGNDRRKGPRKRRSDAGATIGDGN